VQPQVVNVGGLLVLELVCPFAAVLVLGVFPLGTDTLLEEVVIGFDGESGRGCNVVLEELVWQGEWAGEAYVDAPELFDRVEGDDFFEQVIPVFVLYNVS